MGFFQYFYLYLYSKNIYNFGSRWWLSSKNGSRIIMRMSAQGYYEEQICCKQNKNIVPLTET